MISPHSSLVTCRLCARTTSVGAAIALVALFACGDVEGTTPSGSAGAAGRLDAGDVGGAGISATGGATNADGGTAAGGGGISGSAGASDMSQGGASGTASASNAGAGGDAGAGGEAGGSGDAGASGQAGTSGGAGNAGSAGASAGPSCAFDASGFCGGAPAGDWCCGVSGTLFDVEASCWLGEPSASPDIGPVAAQSIVCGDGLCVAQQAPGCYRLTLNGRDVRIWSNSFIINLPPSVVGATDLRKCTNEERMARAADVARPLCP